MTVDPAEPDTFDSAWDGEADAEAPEADAAEQHTELTPTEDDPPGSRDRDTAAEGDLAEQARVVTLDEEEYR
ncbi:hypothetical protein ACN20G_07430 [Streptomyces sp. BI20]|uniref:hypothetical protein n=1 Tax=Streptomyces sp. BI20 TaxID=3403460 RepID=UPI003C77E3C3